jgi:hypothetical protein
MQQSARVESVEAIRMLKGALHKFAETSSAALADAEAELARTLNWLETEQDSFWRNEIRHRTEQVMRAADALRQKKLYKDASGRTQSAVDEERAMASAKRRLTEAEQKLQNVRRYRTQLRREIEQYKGAVQRFATTVQHDVPVAAAKLERMATSLDAYIAVAAPGEKPSIPAEVQAQVDQNSENPPQNGP